ncbi:MAG: DUF2141 domain-containing protein [Bacteroidota bacterium]
MLNKIMLFVIILICIICLIQCKPPVKEKISKTEATKTDSLHIKNNMNNTDSNTTNDTDTLLDSSKEVTLSIHISLLKAIPSTLNISIYGVHNDFPSTSDQLKTFAFKINSSNYTAILKGIKYGTYAIAMYQDENNSGQINKNMLGIPTERYGFSQNYIPKLRAPSFDNCKFEFNEKTSSINIEMIP